MFNYDSIINFNVTNRHRTEVPYKVAVDEVVYKENE